MKVVLAGPSGSGKTTLAKALATHFNWTFVENSAGLIMDDINKQSLKDRFGYGNWGQRKVINESHTQPAFGREFQRYILSARERLINADGNHVYDRSALDPIVFYLNQVVHNDGQEDSEQFIHACISRMYNVDLILRIPLQNPDREIENNESRVNNWFFQRKIDKLYDEAIDLLHMENHFNPHLLDNHQIRILKCPCWEWDVRLAWAINATNQLVQGY